MPNVKLYNQAGDSLGELALNEQIFGIEPNESVVHEAVVQYLASLRRGTSSTKSRGEVRGGGRKPWRQKGTGRARVGTIRSPLWRGGAIIFGPKPRDYAYKLPKKKVALAMRSALSAKVASGELVALDALSFEAPKTKEMVKTLTALEATGKILLVVADWDENVIKSARNIEGVIPVVASHLKVYDVLNNTKMVITKDAIAKIEEVLA